jgi:hypothetical protein
MATALETYQNDPRVMEVVDEASALEKRADGIAITNDATDAEAKAALSVIAKKRKDLEELRKSFVGPLNDHVKTINTFFKERSGPLDTAERIIKGKVSDYFRAKAEAARKEQERQLKLASKRQETADAKAQANGEVAAPPVPVAIIQAPEKTTRTAAGSVTVRKVWKFIITDENVVPRDWCVPNEKAIGAAVKAGIRNIPGVQIYEDEEVAVR